MKQNLVSNKQEDDDYIISENIWKALNVGEGLDFIRSRFGYDDMTIRKGLMRIQAKSKTVLYHLNKKYD